MYLAELPATTVLQPFILAYHHLRVHALEFFLLKLYKNLANRTLAPAYPRSRGDATVLNAISHVLCLAYPTLLARTLCTTRVLSGLSFCCKLSWVSCLVSTHETLRKDIFTVIVPRQCLSLCSYCLGERSNAFLSHVSGPHTIKLRPCHLNMFKVYD